MKPDNTDLTDLTFDRLSRFGTIMIALFIIPLGIDNGLWWLWMPCWAYLMYEAGRQLLK